MISTNLNYIFFIFFYCLVSCQDSIKQESTVINQSLFDKAIVINKIDSSKIQENINFDKEKIIELFFNSFSKDKQTSYVVFDQVRNSHNLITVKKYEDILVGGERYPTYLISFPYENDAPYNSILVSNKTNNDGLILFEKVINEGEYVRISKLNKSEIKNIQYEIEYYTYDGEGNINGEKSIKDSTILASKNFEISNGTILPAESKQHLKAKTVSKKW